MRLTACALACLLPTLAACGSEANAPAPAAKPPATPPAAPQAPAAPAKPTLDQSSPKALSEPSFAIARDGDLALLAPLVDPMVRRDGRWYLQGF